MKGKNKNMINRKARGIERYHKRLYINDLSLLIVTFAIRSNQGKKIENNQAL
jgi:hypothetical protein